MSGVSDRQIQILRSPGVSKVGDKNIAVYPQPDPNNLDDLLLAHDRKKFLEYIGDLGASDRKLKEPELSVLYDLLNKKDEFGLI